MSAARRSAPSSKRTNPRSASPATSTNPPAQIASAAPPSSTRAPCAKAATPSCHSTPTACGSSSSGFDKSPRVDSKEIMTSSRIDMRVDHVSIAVNDIDSALGFFRSIFPIEIRAEKQPGYTDDFNWCDFYIGQFKLELIEGTRPNSFVHRFITKRGEGMHHLSLEVTQLEPLVQRLEADGIRIVDRYQSADGD